MPFNAPAVRGEAEALAAFLGQQQDAFRAVIHGLPTDELAATWSASVLSLGELVRHVTNVQHNWLIGVLAAPDDIPADEFNVAAARTQDFTADSDLELVLKEYDDICARVLDAVAAIPLDRMVPVPDLPWFPQDIDGWEVRWVWLHLVQELARHAGHADIIRETIDGATMYELVAAREGLEPGFLQPWQPSPAPYSRGVSTVVLSADDVAVAGRWYADLLGVPLTFDTPAYVEVEIGPHGHQLGILDRQYAGKDWGQAPDPTGGAVVHLWVPSLEEALDRAMDAGAASYQPIREFSDGGYRGATVVDPFGNLLGLMQRPVA